MTTIKTCIHHWRIQPANGPISTGTCCKCGEMRQFQNTVAADSWSERKTNKDKAESQEIVKAELDSSKDLGENHPG